MRTMTTKGTGGLSLALLLTLGGCGAGGAGGPAGSVQQAEKDKGGKHDGVRIVPIDEDYHDIDYATAAARWQQWAFGAPSAVSPQTDSTGANCAQGQAGPIWWLAGSFGGSTTRSCNIPADKAVFLAILNEFWITFLTDPPQTIKEKRQILAQFMDGATIAIEIDGKSVKKASSYRVASDVFDETFPLDNVLGLDTSICAQGKDGLLHCSPDFNDGYYLLLEPLPAGDHTIHATGTTADGSFSLELTFNLTVG